VKKIVECASSRLVMMESSAAPMVIESVEGADESLGQKKRERAEPDSEDSTFEPEQVEVGGSSTNKRYPRRCGRGQHNSEGDQHHDSNGKKEPKRTKKMKTAAKEEAKAAAASTYKELDYDQLSVEAAAHLKKHPAGKLALDDGWLSAAVTLMKDGTERGICSARHAMKSPGHSPSVQSPSRSCFMGLRASNIDPDIGNGSPRSR
jgi:hypothetical protein